MSEAEILAVRIGLTGLVISVVSVGFGMISAYIAGLWFFLRRAPFFLRLIGFALLSFGLAFMGVLAWGLHEMLLGADRAWTTLQAPATGITDFAQARPPILQGLTIYEASALLGALAFTLIYLALAYLTFLHRWREAE